ncbi:MAG TPA: putative porin [Pyrinomonadaceae bacterium]|nr:putative porin [Pyrinomonadaceae bacterium]
MSIQIGLPNRKLSALAVLIAIALLGLGASSAKAQVIAQSNSLDSHSAVRETGSKPTSASAEVKKSETTEEKLGTLEQRIEQQNRRLDQLQQTITEQQETIRLLMSKMTAQPAPLSTTAARVETETVTPQTPSVEDRLKKVEGRVSEIGAIKFSGDIRLRSESIFGQSNSLTNGDNPAILGNELSPRHRMRLRARLTMRGSVTDEFDWGLRFATGSFADSISTNQTLTDFFNRKPFGLDQAFITYKPKAVPGLRLQGGRFEPPWMFTEMTIDNDLMVDGFNESYSRGFKKSALKDLTFVAWQLPMLERNSAFVRNSNGTVNIDQSRRGGRDLALYGGEVRGRIEPNAKVALSLSASDLFFSGTQFISPVQVFGNQLLLPLTFTIPANGTTPAQTITTQVAIARDLLVAGNGNLGLTNASNNATNRDGRLSSGYNLVDLLAKLELKHSKRFPVTLLFNFVTNTQAHGVVVAGPTGGDVVLPNHENKGFWGEIQVGGTKAKGDTQFGYTFLQIEKDAVLTPFNFSDVTQQSDMRGHRFLFAYAADPRVTLQVTGIVTQRLNGLLGPFAATPAGSLNRSTFRLQLDTVLKF